MPDRKSEITKRLDRSRALLHSIIDHLTPEQWETPVQDADQYWSARQMVSHLYDSEKGMTTQITRIAAGQETVPPDFDVNRWNRRAVEKLAEKTGPELVQSLGETRANLLKVLASLSDADLDKRGRHSSLVIMSIEEILNLIASHEAEHARIVADALKIAVL